MIVSTEIAEIKEQLIRLNRVHGLISSPATAATAANEAYLFVKTGGVRSLLSALERLEVAEARVKEIEDQKPIAWTDDAGAELLGMDAHRVDVVVWRERTDSRRFPLYARSSKDGKQ